VRTAHAALEAKELGPGFRRGEREEAMAFFTYMLASRRNGTLYAGGTDDLVKGVYEHREKLRPGYTARYGVAMLVWFELHGSRDDAFRRERQIKEWRRAWKLELIERGNPGWRDLFTEVASGDGAQAKDWVPASAGTSGEE
jgi:predicted GIY-YIG superfamily endonuclease